MIGWSPRYYIPSFVEIGSPVPEKKIFEGFLPYMGVVAILVNVTSIISDIHFLVPESFYTKFGSDQHRSLWDICMYTTLGQGQEMTLTFNTHTSSYIIQLDVCSYYLSGHWLQ